MYLIQLGATFIGVALAAALGIWLFYFQNEQSEKERKRQLGKALAGELVAVLDILHSPPNATIPDPSGGDADIPVILAQIEPMATEEALRNSLLGPQSNFNLVQLANVMREYRQSSNGFTPFLPYLCAGQLDGPMWIPVYELARDTDRLRQNVIMFCETVIKGLEDAGVKMPPEPKFPSDPNQTVPYP